MKQPIKLVTGAILGAMAVVLIGSVIATDMDIPSGNSGALTAESDPAFVAASNLFLQVEADTVALATGVVLQAQIDELANTTWQDPVIDVDLSTPPVSPTTGDRYIVKATGTGAWATKDANIAEYTGSNWTFTAPVTGMGVNETDSGSDYRYSGSAWTQLLGPSPAKSLTIDETDGTPSITGTTKIRFQPNWLTKSGTVGTIRPPLFSGSGTTGTVTSAAGDAGKYLKADGTWGTASSGVSLNGYDATISPSDIFGWYSGGSIASSNNAAPVYWSSTDANGDYLGIGFTSSDSLMQSRYAFAVPKIPSYASGWGAGTGMVVSVYTSDTGTSSLMDFRLTAPSGTQFSTNGLASSVANTLTHFYIPTASLPGFSNSTATADWTIRFDFKCKSSATSAVSRVRFIYQ